ncbi:MULTISPECIES: Crp/Fnr family transcriptional regulator [Sphingobacterium]|uniref:Crp/Fnr family transcriptional regulator n=1 Tax=Sphingobacterium TaxID=28453 RepID=UPI0013D90614|nr:MULTISPECIES: Crp/Fnr family transcriptional regulator [unclassified Sphingobacterium]
MDIINEIYQQVERENLWDRSITVRRNEYLNTAGTIDTNLYYIVAGSMKVFILDESEEHIVRFGYKNNFITALDSFITGKPTDFYIQTLKRTELKVISKHNYVNLMNSNSHLKELWSIVQQQLIVQQLEREKDILISSPIQRYNRVLQRSPQLFQEVPNKYIASYLRMAPETLSRLKKS